MVVHSYILPQVHTVTYIHTYMYTTLVSNTRNTVLRFLNSFLNIYRRNSDNSSINRPLCIHSR